MTDIFEVDLDDHELFDEILLLTDLMVAALRSDRPLSQEAIDRCLGMPS